MKGKRLIAWLLSVMMVVNSTLSVFASGNIKVNTETDELVFTSSNAQLAENEDMATIQLEEDEETITFSDDELEAEDELIAGYLEQLFYENSEGETDVLGNYGEDSLDPVVSYLYQELKAAVKEIAKGERTSTAVKISMEKTWVEKELGIEVADENGNVTEEAVEMFDILGNENRRQEIRDEVFGHLLVNCPYELYWFDKVTGLGISYSYGYGVYPDNKTVVTAGTFVYNFHVSEDYADGALRVNSSKIEDAMIAAENARSYALDDEYDYSDYDKILEYKQIICELADYNHEAAETNMIYGDPWQIVHVFDEDDDTTVVCEGYSKAFQYLCDMSDITCYTVTGVLSSNGKSGNHMWNIVTLEGNNYLVDVTNCDENENTGEIAVGYPNLLLLAGASGTVESGYTVNLSNGTKVSYKYDADTLKLYSNVILTLSDAAYLENECKVEIISQPDDVVVALAGDTVCLDVEAENVVTYEWYYKATEDAEPVLIENSNTNEWAIIVTEENRGYWYQCMMYDDTGLKKGTNWIQLSDTGWKKDADSWYRYENGELQYSKFIELTHEDTGKVSTYYVDAAGKMALGLTEIDGVLYYFEDEEETEEFGRMKKGGRMTLNGVTYTIDENGVVTKNVLQFEKHPSDAVGIPGDWVRFIAIAENEDVGYQWYYRYRTSTVAIEGANDSYLDVIVPDEYKKYSYWCEIFDGNDNITISKRVEIRDTGWRQEEAGWIYYDSGNLVVNDWVEEKSNKYYVGEHGFMVTGLYEVDGVLHYFDPEKDGAMAVDTTVIVDGDRYVIDENGAAVKGEEVFELISQTKAVYIYDESTFSISVDVTSADTYEWYYRVDGGEWSPVDDEIGAGYDTDTLTVYVTDEIDSYEFYCEVTSAKGDTLTSTPVNITFTPVPTVPGTWKKENGRWRLLDSNGEYVVNSFSADNGQIFYLDAAGYMAETEFIEYNNSLYYFNEKGEMVRNDWVTYTDANGEEQHRFMRSNGRAVGYGSGTKYTINGNVYFFDDDGHRMSGWLKEDESRNIMVTDDWKSAKYYCDEEGVRISGWCTIPVYGGWKNETDYEDHKFYFSSDGTKTVNMIITINNLQYYFDETGAMLSDLTIIIDDIKYVIDSDGVIREKYVIPQIEAPVITAGNVASTGKPELSWAAVEHAVKYQIYRSDSENGNYSLLDTTSSTSYTDTVAEAGDAYFYKIKALDANDSVSEYSNTEKQFCNLARPTVTLSNVASSGKIKVSWAKIDGAVKYEVHRATSAGGTYTRLITTTGTSITNTSAETGVTYYYKVKAIHNEENANSEFSAVKYRVCDLPRPEVTVSNVASTGKVKLNWTKVDGAAKYEVYRATSKTGKYDLLKTTTGTSLTNTSTTAGTTYYYKVRALHTETSAHSAYSEIKNRACDLPQPTLTVSNVASTGKVKLNWTKVEGAVKYEVWRATSKTGKYDLLKTTTGTSLTNTSTTAGTTYYYKVRALHENTSAHSAYSEIKNRACDLPQPTLTVSNVASTGKVKLSWTKVDGAVKYEVYRATSKTGEYNLLKTTTGTSLTNTSTTVGTTYYYKVRALHENTSAHSAYSEIRNRTCDLARPTVELKLNSKGKPVITWNAVSGAVKYEVYYATSADGEYKLLKTMTGRALTHGSAATGTTFYYKVKAIHTNSAANSAYSTVKFIKIK